MTIGGLVGRLHGREYAVVVHPDIDPDMVAQFFLSMEDVWSVTYRDVWLDEEGSTWDSEQDGNCLSDCED